MGHKDPMACVTGSHSLASSVLELPALSVILTHAAKLPYSTDSPPTGLAELIREVDYSG